MHLKEALTTEPAHAASSPDASSLAIYLLSKEKANQVPETELPTASVAFNQRPLLQHSNPSRDRGAQDRRKSLSMVPAVTGRSANDAAYTEPLRRLFLVSDYKRPLTPSPSSYLQFLA